MLLLSLRRKLFLAALVVLIPALGIIFWIERNSFHAREELVLDREVGIAQTTAAHLDTVFDQVTNVGWALAEAPSIRSFNHGEMDTYLQRLADRYPDFLDIEVFNASGESMGTSVPYSPGQPRINVAEAPHFQQAMATGRPALSLIQRSERWDGKLITVLVVPILENGRAVGTVHIVLDLDYITSLIGEIPLESDLGLVLVDPEGQIAFVQTGPDSLWVEWDPAGVAAIEAALAGETVEDTRLDCPAAEGECLAAYVRSPQYGWVVGVTLPVRAVLTQAAPVQRQVLAGVALIAILGGLIVSALSHHFVGPLRRLIAAARAMGEGDLGQRVNIRTGDEAEVLARVFNNMVDRIAATVQDLEAARNEAEAQRAQLQTIVEQIPEGVIIVEAPSGQISLLNRSARRLLGNGDESEAVEYKVVADLLKNGRFLRPNGELYTYEELPLIRALHGETSLGSEIIVVRPSGTRLILLGNIAPVFDDRHHISGAVAVFQDITQRKTAEQFKEEFLSLAAHELKTPLTSIKGCSQLLLKRSALRQTSSENADAELLRTINERVNYVGGLVNELLDLSRIQTGRLDLHPRRIDLAALLHDVVAEQQALHPDHPMVLEGARAPCIGMWDQGRLEQTFVNLIDNAVKYSQAEKPITVRLDTGTPHLAHVTVEDRGIGIPADALTYVFERHYRAANSGPAPSGLGLGLYIAHDIIQRHGGRIWAESIEGRGSTFHVVLPTDGTGTG